MAKRPNVIFIIADDHRHDAIGAAGDRTVRTPVLDALAQAGTMMSSTHINGGVDGAVCVPCRACVHTGNPIFQATESQKIGDHANTHVIRRGAATMPSWFREHGYHTHAIGKWHNDKASFTEGFGGGEALFFGGMSDHGQVPVFDYDATGRYPPEVLRIESKHSTELFTDAAIGFIEQYREEAPFFLYLAYTAPHDPRTAPEPYASMYAADQIELPPNYMDEHPFDNGELDIRDENLAEYPRKQAEVRTHIADYYAMISHLDHHIGKMLQALADSGKAENTLVVYTADHGLAVGQHGLLGKQNVYDHSIRVPWLVKGPGVPPSRRVDALVYHYDIFPTLCGLVGIAPPVGIGGINMEALVRGESDEGRDTVYSFYKDIQRMIKDDRWKMIRYRRSADTGQGSDTLQLFDLVNDPWELSNLAFDPRYRPQIDKLMRDLAAWEARVGDPYGDEFP